MKISKKTYSVPKFDYIISNPPYQNTQNRPIFHCFQKMGTNIAKSSIMIYMASRWWYGTTGLPEFRKELLTNRRLKRVHYFHERETNKTIFPGTLISGGLTIVELSNNENAEGFTLSENLTNFSTKILHDDSLMPLKASYASLAKKLLYKMKEMNISTLYNRDESAFVNEIGLSAQQVKKLNPISLEEAKKIMSEKEFDESLKLYANISGERTGKASYYVISRDLKVLNDNKYRKNLIQEDKYKICMGQSIIENENRSIRLFHFDKNTTYGRAAISLAFFDTKIESENFYKYASTKFFEFCLRLSIAGRLKTFGVFVPDFEHYLNNSFIQWNDLTAKELDNQLYNIFDLSIDEIKLIEKEHLIKK